MALDALLAGARVEAAPGERRLGRLRLIAGTTDRIMDTGAPFGARPVSGGIAN